MGIIRKNIFLLTLPAVLTVLLIACLTTEINIYIMLVMLAVGLVCCIYFPSIKSKKLKYISSIIFAVFFVTAFVSFIFITLADNMLFHPNQNISAYNSNKNNGELTEIVIENGDNTRLCGWMRKSGTDKSPLIIYFGGNGECSADAFNNFSSGNRWQTFEPYSFMMIDYPGYGLSDSKPTNKSMFEMAEKAYDYAVSRDDVDGENIVVMGYSIGTGVASYIASERNVSSLILLAPYDEGRSLYNDFLNIFHGPMNLLVRNKFLSKKYAKKIDVSPLILASKADELVPYELSVNLSKYFKHEPQFFTFESIGHNDYWGYEDTYNKIHNYLLELED